jgi:hypothetical protein
VSICIHCHLRRRHISSSAPQVQFTFQFRSTSPLPPNTKIKRCRRAALSPKARPRRRKAPFCSILFSLQPRRERLASVAGDPHFTINQVSRYVLAALDKCRSFREEDWRVGTKIDRWLSSPEYIDQSPNKSSLSAKFPHIPRGQPGFINETGCPSASRTETFVLGLGKNPCLLSMLPVTRVPSKQKIVLLLEYLSIFWSFLPSH